MRLAARDQICEILATMYEGVKYAINAKSEAHSVLYDCADAVNAVRDALATQLSEERAGFYFEYIDAISDGFESFTEKAGEILEILSVIYDELIAESEVKLKVAFFPYKASMWDCMESIWMAARDDMRCEVDVVPIRYADRNPDGLVIKTTCERDSFPDYVPITRFEDYDPAVDAPDIAYIHNPYDGNNYVTSVDPTYYSHELKKHVGALVYVPYYVSNFDTGENMACIVCATAADIIVAQSKRDTETFNKIDPARDVPSLGSPKVDRILRYEREKPSMPPEWRDKLSGKKVFLLNTSVSTLLRYDEQFCDKLNYIFDTFESRDDIALLWRPHPLSEATMNSMRPGLVEGYIRLTRRIHDIGVFDETADVTRAIALSDAYIGEGATSLLYMYAVTGKPTYQLDFDITRAITAEERGEILRSASTAPYLPEEGGKTSLTTFVETNEICRIELETGRVMPLAPIPGISSDDIYMYGRLIDCGDKYILPPACYDRFIELDRDFKLIKTVQLPDEAKADAVFLISARCGDYIIFVPSRSKAFARYRISTGEYEFFYDWYKDFEKYVDKHDPDMFTASVCVAGGKLYLACYKDNIIVELDPATMKLKSHKIGLRSFRYYSVAHDGKCFWLTRFRPPGIDNSRWSDSIVRWDPKLGKTEELKKFPSGFEPGYMSFTSIVPCGTYLLAFPYQANMIIKIDSKTGKMSEFGAGLIKTPENTDEFLVDPKNVACGYSACFGDTVFSYLVRDRALLKIDVKTGKTNKVLVRFDDEHRVNERCDKRWFMPAKFDRSNKGIFSEKLLFSPEEFINKLCSGEISPENKEQAEFYLKKVANSDGTSGERIHKYVMGKFGFEEGAQPNGTV